MDEKKQIRGLTGLKCVFIMMIILTHTLPHSPLIRQIPLTSFIINYGGSWGNSLFFTISGYLLSMGYRKRIQTGVLSFSDYLGRRLSKIYPMYILSNLAAIPYNIIKNGFSVVNLKRIALVGLLQAGGALENEYPFNGPAWFVCTLFVCYILYYFLTRHSKNNTQYYCYLAAGIIIGYILANRNFTIPYCYNENGVAYINFFTGCALTEIISGIPEKNHKKMANISLVILAVCACGMLKIGVEAFVGTGVLGYTFFLNPMILYIGTVPNLGRRILESKPVFYLGKISISLYFWHMPLYYLFCLVNTQFRGTEILSDGAFLIYLLTLFPVSILLYNILEKKPFGKT